MVLVIACRGCPHIISVEYKDQVVFLRNKTTEKVTSPLYFEHMLNGCLDTDNVVFYLEKPGGQPPYRFGCPLADHAYDKLLDIKCGMHNSSSSGGSSSTGQVIRICAECSGPITPCTEQPLLRQPLPDDPSQDESSPPPAKIHLHANCELKQHARYTANGYAWEDLEDFFRMGDSCDPKWDDLPFHWELLSIAEASSSRRESIR